MRGPDRLAHTAALALLLGGIALTAQPRPPAPPVPSAPAAPRAPCGPAAPAPGRPGVTAPPRIVQELQATLTLGIQRFEAKDLAGVLTQVSDQYWTGPLTKPTLRTQLLTLFQIYQELRARVRIDEVRLVGEHAWIYSTGEISGQLPVMGQWVPVLAWEHELEVARRENGAWRLFGYQQ